MTGSIRMSWRSWLLAALGGTLLVFTSESPVIEPASGSQVIRSFEHRHGRFRQADPAGLTEGESNRFQYAASRPLMAFDPIGLLATDVHFLLTMEALKDCDITFALRLKIAWASAAADWTPTWKESQSVPRAHWHGMSQITTMGDLAPVMVENFIKEQMSIGTPESVGRAVHVVQDRAAAGHRGYQRYTGHSDIAHVLADAFPSAAVRYLAIANTRLLFPECSCKR